MLTQSQYRFNYIYRYIVIPTLMIYDDNINIDNNTFGNFPHLYPPSALRFKGYGLSNFLNLSPNINRKEGRKEKLKSP
ncbi:conserved protein of unknown function [Shewanella benthica]|uniref:Uncharacterized protein n=1 Tax=Shewanella benthica TaxID=43661 RepID=A0A330M454_9GAMM|nr:conserved protein of unknown function [Shewanella benthica]